MRRDIKKLGIRKRKMRDKALVRLATCGYDRTFWSILDGFISREINKGNDDVEYVEMLNRLKERVEKGIEISQRRIQDVDLSYAMVEYGKSRG